MAEDALRKLRPLHGVSRSCPPSALLSKHGHGLPWPSAKIGAVHIAHIDPRTYLCYDSKNRHSPECQEIMVALLDDTLLDYRTTYPFLLVVDVALYLLLEKGYFQRQIATYALLTL